MKPSTRHEFWPQLSREGITSRKLWFNHASDREEHSVHYMAGEPAEITVFPAPEGHSELGVINLFYINTLTAAVAEWYRYRTVACLVTSSSPVPLKTRRVGQRCTLNLSRAETSSRWCGVVVRRGGASSGVVHVT
ncbi:uncharacterized protein TNCV_359971 [Trichonephila clavipes]|uniref:Uncharacterized protein n=1 Tax=Trichonephila clavipes TaxID=2585209 RepID=A0A8X6VL30_TRICX|nr:uncharacterized protein TNCV_359971 [Trichonephila clavipes]